MSHNLKAELKRFKQIQRRFARDIMLKRKPRQNLILEARRLSKLLNLPISIPRVD